MSKNTTKYTEESIHDFLNHFVKDEQKREDSEALIAIMEELSGSQAKMWGSTIIGFGQYTYTYASGHSGEAPLISFSPRKSAFSLYIYTGQEEHSFLLEGLGKFKMGKSCIYIQKPEDIHSEQLKKLMAATILFYQTNYKTSSLL